MIGNRGDLITAATGLMLMTPKILFVSCVTAAVVALVTHAIIVVPHNIEVKRNKLLAHNGISFTNKEPARWARESTPVPDSEAKSPWDFRAVSRAGR